jgi:hypothetical protein
LDRKATLVTKEISEKESVSSLTQEQLDKKGKFKHSDITVENID